MNQSVCAAVRILVCASLLVAAACSRDGKPQPETPPPVEANGAPSPQTPVADLRLVARIQATMGNVTFRDKIPQRGDAVALCDKWIPVAQPARWCDRESDPAVRAMLIDAARLQEGGFSVSAEVMARNAVAAAGQKATPAAKALTSAFIDMYKPTEGHASDVTDEQFNADLSRFWKVWQDAEKLIAGVEPKNRATVELLVKGTLYRDDVAVSAARSLSELSTDDRKYLADALARIQAFHESEGR